MFRKEFIAIICLLLIFNPLVSISVIAQEDNQIPNVENVEVSSSIVSVGDVLVIKAKITDNSGVAAVSLDLKTPSNFKRDVYLYFNNTTGLWEGSYKIQPTDESGVWISNFLFIKDKAGNYGSMNPNISFEVINGTEYEDTQEPLVESIQLNLSEVRVGESVKVKAKITDKSGVNAASLDIRTPSNFKRNLYLYYNDLTGFWEGTYKILMTDEPGVWTSSFMFIKDNAGNYGSMNPKISFNVINDSGEADSQFPLVDSIELNPSNVTIGDLVEVKAKITDSSGVQAASLDLKSPSKFNRDVYLYFNSLTGYWEGSYRIQTSDELGLWTSNFMFIKDNAGNYGSINPNLSFQVVQDLIAPGKPHVNPVSDQSYKVSGMAEPRSVITIKSAASYLGSGTASSDGNFEVSIPIQSAGTKLSIHATDASGNQSEVAETVVSDGTPPAPPVVHVLKDNETVVKGTAEPQSTIKVKLDNILLGEALTTKEGIFEVSIPKQKANSTLTIFASDKSLNLSDEVIIVVQDGTAPNIPLIHEVSDQSIIVTGIAEANATVEVIIDRKIVTSGLVQSNGEFSLNIPMQIAGVQLTFTVIDKAGNKSEQLIVTVSDKTNPTILNVTPVSSTSTSISGHTEGTTKVKLFKDEVLLAETESTSKGEFSLVFAPQKSGSELILIATDLAGNDSEPFHLTVHTQITYYDFPSTHWAFEQVMYLVDAKVIGGYPDGSFQADRQTTRAEAARMLATALKLDVVDTPSIFKDVASTHWANDYIVAAAKAGIFKGNPDGTFNPNGKLTRAEMAILLSTAYELSADKPAHFSDVKASHWANDAIAAMFENDLTVGYPDGTYRPSNPTTRAEFSMFLAKALNSDFR